jgi:hypothetical protein
MPIDVSQIQKFLQEGYELKELPGGFWAPKPSCSDYKLECGASLTDSAAKDFIQKCQAPSFDIDNDGQGEYVIAWDPNSKILEVIKKTKDGWKAICYQLVKPPENPVEMVLSAIGNFAFQLLPAQVLAGLGTVGRIVGGFLGGIASSIESAVGLGIIVVVLVAIIILKR